MELKKNDKVKVKLIEKEFEGIVIGTPYNLLKRINGKLESIRQVEVYIKDLNIDMPIDLDLIEKIN